jgi:hypothetical protein
MSQQPHDMGYLDYTGHASRSPTSSRQNYGAGFASGLTLPRQPQRPFDVPLGSSALYPSDRIGSGYNPRAIDSMSGHGGMPGGYMLDNGQSWNYNSVGVATVNGAINGPNRQRSVNRRAALPQVRDACPGAQFPVLHANMTLRRPGQIKAPWGCPTMGYHHSRVV